MSVRLRGWHVSGDVVQGTMRLKRRNGKKTLAWSSQKPQIKFQKGGVVSPVYGGAKLAH